SPFAHHYSGNRFCFLFLRVLRCFTSPRYHHAPYAFRRRRPPMTVAGFPHSETPGSQLGCQLPGAYRRLQRPSSAPGAKASTVCPKKLGTTKTHYKPTVSQRNRRCSRPLCSSQETDGNQNPARTTAPAGNLARNEETSAPEGACPLRTQQRAHPAPPP